MDVAALELLVEGKIDDGIGREQFGKLLQLGPGGAAEAEESGGEEGQETCSDSGWFHGGRW
jgi:hypothetical protein